jgi:hypothetical protein
MLTLECLCEKTTRDQLDRIEEGLSYLDSIAMPGELDDPLAAARGIINGLIITLCAVVCGLMVVAAMWLVL